MNTVNANDLIAAGVAFHMRDEEVEFGADGELLGYSEVVRDAPEHERDPDTVGDHRNRWFATGEGLTDTSELSDDADRWAHLADAHVSEQRRVEWLTQPRKSDHLPEYGAWEFFSRQRSERFERLRRFALRARRQRRWEVLAKMKAGVVTRQAESAEGLSVTGAKVGTPPWARYLTAAQVSYLMRI